MKDCSQAAHVAACSFGSYGPATNARVKHPGHAHSVSIGMDMPGARAKRPTPGTCWSCWTTG